MADIATFSRVEARRHQACRDSLYGADWEVCDGSQGIPPEEAAEWIDNCTHDDRRTYKRQTTEYRFVPGRVLTNAEYDAWLSLESTRDSGVISPAAFILTLE